MDSNLTFSHYADDSFSELDYNSDPLVRIIASNLMFVLVLFGFFGNLALIFIVFGKWRIQTAFNLFVANIAFVDACITLSMTTTLLTHMFFGEFIFGETVCKVLHLIDNAAPMISVLSITVALIVLQFEVIGYKYSVPAIGLIYIISMPFGVISAQYAAITQSLNGDSEIILNCFRLFPTHRFENTMYLLGRALTVDIPASWLLIYFLLWIVSKCRKEKILRGFAYDKLMTAMAILSILAWSMMLNLSMLPDLPYDTIYVVIFVIHVIVGFSISIKPILYAVAHEGYRRELGKLVGWKSNSMERRQLF